MRDKSVSLTVIGTGALAGIIATVPMTVSMFVLKKLLPPRQQYELPPEQIVEDLADTAGTHCDLRARETQLVVWTAHHGYGALMGMLYGGTSHYGSSIFRGMTYGVGIWAANYLGVLPAVGAEASAHKEPVGRNALMIVSHVVWGATLEVAFRSLNAAETPEMSQGP